MEWNHLGLSNQGMEALASAVIANKNLISLDLRNNQIANPSAIYISDIIRQSSLQSLDLRWNRLDITTVKSIASALQGNTKLHKLELEGNELNEIVLAYIRDVLNRNKGTKDEKLKKEIVKVMFSPAKTMSVLFSNKSVNTIDKLTDYRTRYDAELIEKQRTERKLNDVEQQLSQERNKNQDIREELLKTVDTEKKVSILINYLEIQRSTRRSIEE